MTNSLIIAVVDKLPYRIQNVLKGFKFRVMRSTVVHKWEKSGKRIPPPHAVKQMAIEYYQSRFGYQTLVETGTYLGNMIIAQKDNFSKIYSIELGEELYKNAVKRFKHEKHVTLMRGDSGIVLDTITRQLEQPAIFWLDGHYSGGITALGDKACPILGEIDAIMRYKTLNHVLLVDDARCFKGKNSYPTVEALTRYIQSKNPEYVMENKDDILRYTIA